MWPSIPNPGNSSAIQKIDREYELVSGGVSVKKKEKKEKKTKNVT